jgi:hypothetical protein
MCSRAAGLEPNESISKEMGEKRFVPTQQCQLFWNVSEPFGVESLDGKFFGSGFDKAGFDKGRILIKQGFDKEMRMRRSSAWLYALNGR